MQNLRRIVRIDVAGAALVAALAAMPALAALPFEMPLAGKALALRDWILMGSLALLAVSVALWLMRRRGSDDTSSLADGPDMRWWRNS